VHACLIDADGAVMDAAGTEALEDGGAYTLSISCEVPLPPGVDMRALDEKWHEGPSGRVADSGVFETPGAESVHAADKPLAQALRKFFMGRRRKPHRGRSVFDLGCGDGAVPAPTERCQRERQEACLVLTRVYVHLPWLDRLLCPSTASRRCCSALC
jgi:hypothetical protein